MALTQLYTYTPGTAISYAGEDFAQVYAELNALRDGKAAADGKVTGSTQSGGSLTLVSTAHATKGKIYFGAAQVNHFDEAGARLVMGTISGSTASGGNLT